VEREREGIPRPWWALAVLAGCFAVYLGFTATLIPLAADDTRLASVFSVDEADIAVEMGNLHRGGVGRAPSYKYGGAFYYLVLGPLKVIGLSRAVSERAILLTVRTLCAAAGAGCLWMTYAIGRVLFGRAAGLLAMLLLTTHATFLRWSVEAHPDLPQLFWMLAALYVCCCLRRRLGAREAAAGAALAGIAFGTKYAGGFLLPVIVLGVWLSDEGGSLNPAAGWLRLRDHRVYAALAAALLGFVVGFAATSPHAALHPVSLWESLMAEKAIMGFGHRVRMDTGGWLWPRSLAGAMGYGHAAVLVGYLGVRIVQWCRSRKASGEALLLVWILVYVGYLVLEVRLTRGRHLLPVLPAAFVLASAGYARAWRWLGDRRRLWAGIRGALPVLVVVASWSQISASVGFWQVRRERPGHNEEIAAGRWIGEFFPPHTTVLYDAYAYVPTAFREVFRTVGMSYVTVNHFEPDLLVVRQAIANDYGDPGEAEEARIGRGPYLDRHYFYRYLLEGRIPTYRLLKAFGSVQVHGRTSPKVRAEEDKRTAWWERVQRHMDNRAYGVVSARWAMGSIHAALGYREEARRQFDLAREASNFLQRVYKHGLRELASGRPDEARGAFREALAAAASQPAHYQATMHQDLARRYFGSGLYEDALEQARKALALSPGLTDAQNVATEAESRIGDLRTVPLN